MKGRVQMNAAGFFRNNDEMCRLDMPKKLIKKVKRIIKENAAAKGIPENEYRAEMQTFINLTWYNNTTEAAIMRMNCRRKGEVATPEEYILYVIERGITMQQMF